jgi:hypothetical protein
MDAMKSTASDKLARMEIMGRSRGCPHCNDNVPHAPHTCWYGNGIHGELVNHWWRHYGDCGNPKNEPCGKIHPHYCDTHKEA